MLVLSRKIGEKILVGENIEVVVVDVRGDKVRLGIQAPKDIPVHREEITPETDLASPENLSPKDPDTSGD
jgi:carbon storage regulator